jgi:hypothetical protein
MRAALQMLAGQSVRAKRGLGSPQRDDEDGDDDMVVVVMMNVVFFRACCGPDIHRAEPAMNGARSDGANCFTSWRQPVGQIFTKKMTALG